MRGYAGGKVKYEATIKRASLAVSLPSGNDGVLCRQLCLGAGCCATLYMVAVHKFKKLLPVTDKNNRRLQARVFSLSKWRENLLLTSEMGMRVPVTYLFIY